VAEFPERAFKAFISYSTDPDYKISQRVESFVETFHRMKLPPGIKLSPVQVCRDGSDFSVQRTLKNSTSPTVVEDLIASYLAESEYLVLLCSTRTPASRFVDFEIRWFLEQRGPEFILLAVTEGNDPSAAPETVFPQAVLDAGLHLKPFYDLRRFHGRAAAGWRKVRDAEEELANLAAFLHGDTSGRLWPLWQREAIAKVRRQRLIFAVAAAALAGLAGVAFWQRSQAVEERDRAERALAESRARALVLAGEASIEKDPQLSLLLAIEGTLLAQASGGDAGVSVSSLLRRAVLAAPRRIGDDVRGIECFAIRPDGESVAVGTQKSGVFELSLKYGSVVGRYPSTQWVDTVDWSPDGKLLAVGSRDNTVTIWDTASRQIAETLRFENSPQSVHWRSAGHQLAIGLANANNSPTKVWDFFQKRELFEVPGMRAAWSPNGELLASGGGDGKIFLSTADGTRLAELPGHSRYVHKVVWHPGGRLFATASVDDTVMVWDAVSRALVKRLENEFALSAAWSPDGHALASGSGSRFVTVWETREYKAIFEIAQSATITGREIQESGAAGYVLDVSWSPDGKSFLVADREGGILVYAAILLHARSDSDWLATARAQLTRELTESEAQQYGLNRR
jgi:hypothetical protein